MIRTYCLLLLVALFLLAGCNKTPAKPKDAVEAKLQELAGGDATNCGRLPVQADKELKTASDCAIDAAQKRHPFYVGYDMPGMSVGVAGNSAGSLFSVEAQGEAGSQQVTSGACPAALRETVCSSPSCDQIAQVHASRRLDQAQRPGARAATTWPAPR